jgi:hypothetical protein
MTWRTTSPPLYSGLAVKTFGHLLGTDKLSIKVGGTLFRVPKHHFIEQSEVFRDMFELPVADDTVPDGLTDEQPLRLEGVSEVDFRQLLRAMFPR